MRLLHITSHPIQYQAPLFRRIAAEPDVRLRVLFARDTEAGGFDPGFQRDIRWDVPLRGGYDSVFRHETDWTRELAECDAVWMHGWQGAWMARVLARARALGKPVLMRGENTDAAMPDGAGLRGWAKRRYLAWIFARCSAFLAIGEANREYYRRRGVPADRIFSMPYAVDNEFFRARAAEVRPHRAELRRALGLDARPIVLFAGKLMARKHPDRLLGAWARAAWPDRRPILLFVGDGAMRASLERAAPPDVHFLGFRNQTELPALYDLADVFVLPSEGEPWGLAVNESMACGTAVIVSDQVGCARDLVDSSCGAVVPAGDEESLARALVDVIGRSAAAGEAAARRIAGWDFEADIAGLRAALRWVAAHGGRTP